MNFNITAVFSPLERAELKKKFNQQKRLEAQLNKVGQQAARAYKSTVQVRRVPRSKIVAADEDDIDEITPTPPGPPPPPSSPSQQLTQAQEPPPPPPPSPSSSPR